MKLQKSKMTKVIIYSNKLKWIKHLRNELINLFLTSIFFHINNSNLIRTNYKTKQKKEQHELKLSFIDFKSFHNFFSTYMTGF